MLNRNNATRVTGSAMSRGAVLPMGSVGISLKRILASGAVKKDELGRLKLGA